MMRKLAKALAERRSFAVKGGDRIRKINIQRSKAKANWRSDKAQNCRPTKRDPKTQQEEAEEERSPGGAGAGSRLVGPQQHQQGIETALLRRKLESQRKQQRLSQPKVQKRLEERMKLR